MRNMSARHMISNIYGRLLRCPDMCMAVLQNVCVCVCVSVGNRMLSPGRVIHIGIKYAISIS